MSTVLCGAAFVIAANTMIAIERQSVPNDRVREIKITKNVYDPTRTHNEPIRIPDNGNDFAEPGFVACVPKEFSCTTKHLK